MEKKNYYLNQNKFWDELKSGKFASMVKESTKGKILKDSSEVYNILKPLFAKEDDVDQFYCIFLDTKNRVIAIEKLFSGSPSCTMIHCREIVKEVLKHKALSIIIGHNHPSGDIEPSQEDYEVTKKIKLAMEVIEGNLLDHMIIGDEAYVMWHCFVVYSPPSSVQFQHHQCEKNRRLFCPK